MAEGQMDFVFMKQRAFDLNTPVRKRVGNVVTKKTAG